MKNLSEGRLGFTLIELLVVVLIVGILASIALPQYRKAVEKSRATEGLALLKAVHQAQLSYYLSNGAYARSFDELDVGVPWTGDDKWSTSTFLRDTRSNGKWSLQIYATSTAQALFLGLVSGPYAGAGFTIWLNSSNRPEQTLLCAERQKDGLAFGKDPGDYCIKIFRGTHAYGNHTTNIMEYTLP